MANQLITKRRIQQGIVQYALITLLIAVLGGYFGYMNYSEYQAATVALNSETENLSQLKVSAEKSKIDYENLKKQMDQTNSGVNESIEKILPPEESFTDLARQLDKYFLDSRVSSNPMFLSDLRFNTARLDTDHDYSTLPFSMNISGDEDGFKQFLNYISKTGELTDKSRLMNIASIALTFQQPVTGSGSSTGSVGGEDGLSGTIPTSVPNSLNTTVPLVTASMNLNAYFQKPLDASTTAAAAN